MYGWMAVVIFAVFGEIPKTNPTFWFMMQIAMLAGFITSYPANWWLLKREGLRKGCKDSPALIVGAAPSYSETRGCAEACDLIM
jgi:hypothetical protein